jgi:hypothetical protein
MMPKLTFYRQGRADGAIRTGIELDEDTIFETYEASGSEVDPTLLWYIDLRCKGPGIPSDPQEAKHWLLDSEAIIRAGFSRCANEFEAGRDVELYPIFWSKFHELPEGVEITIACATNRRIWALSVPKLLEDVAEHWRERIEHLEPAEWVA